MKEYEGNMTLYEEIWMNMWKIWRNMSTMWRNMKKYVNILDLALPYLYGPWDLEKFREPPSYSLWDLEKFRILPLCMDLGTWKNSTPELPPGLWNLEKFQALPLYRLIQALGLGKKNSTPEPPPKPPGTYKKSELCLYTGSGIWKNVELPFLRFQPVGEVSLFCLL